MKKKLVLGVVLCICLLSFSRAFAQEEMVGNTEQTRDWRREIRSDRQELKDEWQVLKEDSKEAKQEERQMQQQIHEAVRAGDFDTAKSLREQLRAMHKENVQERRENKKDIQDARKELKEDIKAAHKEGVLPPHKKWGNPPGYNPPGRGPGNPPGYNPPGRGPVRKGGVK